MNYVISQILGIVVTIVCLISPQLKKKWQMCCVTVIANVISAIGMLLVGAYSTMVCCFVAIFQALRRIWHLEKGTKFSIPEMAIFGLLYIGGGLLPYILGGTLAQFGWLDLMPIVGAIMLMISIAQKKEQPSRAFGLANACIFFVYFLIIWNTQIFAQIASIVSSVLALVRYSKKGKSAELSASGE